MLGAAILALGSATTGATLNLEGRNSAIHMEGCTIASTCSGRLGVLYAYALLADGSLSANLSSPLMVERDTLRVRVVGVPASCASVSDIDTPCAAHGEPFYPPRWSCTFGSNSSMDVGPVRGTVDNATFVDCPLPSNPVLMAATGVALGESTVPLTFRVTYGDLVLPWIGLPGGGTVVLSSLPPPPPPFSRAIYNFTGALQTLTLPPHVTSFSVAMWGAGGSGGHGQSSTLGGHGGAGGALLANVTGLAPGVTLQLTVGESRASADDTRPCPSNTACTIDSSVYSAHATFGGGGLGGGRNNQRRGGDGGGGSWITLEDGTWLVAVGGGGGGNGQWSEYNGATPVRHGGSGGGTHGLDGTGSNSPPTGGFFSVGGSIGSGGGSGGGAAGYGNHWTGVTAGGGVEPCTDMPVGACLATAGSLGEGGYATGGVVPRDVHYGAGGGGGGGYYGGGGGDGGKQYTDAQSGAGGCGYLHPSYSSGTFHQTTRDPSDDSAEEAPLTTDDAYVAGVAVGGAGSAAGLSLAGGHGLIVITYI